MIDSLRFVQGAVARKDYQPALTHFYVNEGRITGYNGTLALSSPIALDIHAMPKAIPFVRAIENCTDEEATAVYMTPGGRLALRSGAFRAYIDCLEDDDIFQQVRPDGANVPLNGKLLPALRALEPFIGIDASRPWATGILLEGPYAYATNNIILVQYWIGEHAPVTANLPGQAVREILRIGLEPELATITENHLTLHYSGERWLRTGLLNPDWPNIDSLLDACTSSAMEPVPDGFYEALDKLAPFVNERGAVYFHEGHMATSTEEDDGAAIALAGLPVSGCYNNAYLAMLKGVAAAIDFTTHPKPCGFVGDSLRGVILGMRQ
jgi:DNA polymerase III sliding clamp (beta) subunit (PCNA family)